MYQYAVMGQKSRDVSHHKSDIFQKRRNFDRQFFGFDADISQKMQGMQIKYRASEKPIQPIIQMDIGKAKSFREIAKEIAKDSRADYTRRTVGVSNRRFAISPQLGGNRQQERAQAKSKGRQYAGPVPGGNQIGNHVERKLIYYDKGLTEIGVNRTICSACEIAICGNAANIAHVSDPDGTYAVYADRLEKVDN